MIDKVRVLLHRLNNEELGSDYEKTGFIWEARCIESAYVYVGHSIKGSISYFIGMCYGSKRRIKWFNDTIKEVSDEDNKLWDKAIPLSIDYTRLKHIPDDLSSLEHIEFAIV